jgi:hypothetical protein
MNTQEVKIVVNGSSGDRRSLIGESVLDRLTKAVLERKKFFDRLDHSYLMDKELYRSGRYHDTEGCVANAVSGVFDSTMNHFGGSNVAVADTWTIGWFENATDDQLSELANKSLINRMGRDYYYAFEKEY